ncbi:MAG TPA: hypothetical protein VGE96_00970 [Steroidobacteraceae bacterium]|jgi:hypothetical protein
MKPTKPITDRSFHYHSAASHSDVKRFERRMLARRKLAARRARQEATAPGHQAEVQPITQRRQKA